MDNFRGRGYFSSTCVATVQLCPSHSDNCVFVGVGKSYRGWRISNSPKCPQTEGRGRTASERRWSGHGSLSVDQHVSDVSGRGRLVGGGGR